MRFRALAAAVAALLAGCGEGVDEAPRLPPAVRIGSGPAHRPPPLSPGVRSAAPAGRLRCTGNGRQRVGVHLEVFGGRRTVIVPAGIGIAPPWAGRAPYVRSGRCSYPVRTREPTGVIEVAAGARVTLGDFFEVWGQALTPRRVATFRGATRVWVD